MKRTILIALLLILITSASLSQAQDTPPWPPDPVEIFAEGVEIVDYKVVYKPFSQDRQGLSPKLDNDARTLQVYDFNHYEWKTFPYPDEVAQFSSIQDYGSSLLLLNPPQKPSIHARPPDPTGQWLFNIRTGTFFRPELICGKVPPASGPGKWMVYQLTQETPAYLCNTRSGQRYGPLPEDQQWSTEKPVEISPDGSQIILFASSEVYAYAVDSQALTALGSIDSYFDWIYAKWLGNRLVLIYSGTDMDTVFPGTSYYLADPLQVDSMKFVAFLLPGYPLTYLEDPPRYQWVWVEDSVCYLVWAHVETGQLDKFDLGDLCTEGVFLPDGSGDLLVHDIQWRCLDVPEGVRIASFPESAKLVRLNPTTGERIDLLEGEIEWIMSISPDARYATLILDESGDISMSPHYMSTLHCSPNRNNLPDMNCKNGQPSLVVIDLTTGEIRYTVVTSWRLLFGSFWPYHYSYWPDNGRLSRHYITLEDIDYTGQHIYPTDDLLALGSDLFLLIARENEPYQATLIDLSGEETVEIPLGELDIARIMPESWQLLFWVDGKNPDDPDGGQVSTALSLYDIPTGTTHPVINAVPEERYRLRLGGIADDGTLTISSGLGTAMPLDAIRYVDYTIRLPNLR